MKSLQRPTQLDIILGLSLQNYKRLSLGTVLCRFALAALILSWVPRWRWKSIWSVLIPWYSVTQTGSHPFPNKHVYPVKEGFSHLLLKQLPKDAHALLQHLLVIHGPEGCDCLPCDHGHQYTLLLLQAHREKHRALAVKAQFHIQHHCVPLPLIFSPHPLSSCTLLTAPAPPPPPPPQHKHSWNNTKVKFKVPLAVYEILLEKQQKDWERNLQE